MLSIQIYGLTKIDTSGKKVVEEDGGETHIEYIDG